MDPRAALRQRIHDELRHHSWAVAQRLLTKAFDAYPELDAPARQALREELDAAIEAAEPPAPVRADTASAQDDIARPAFDPARIGQIVADAMHAPTDGSAARFEVLAARARQQLAIELERCGVGWWRAWRLRRRLEAGLRRERVTLVRPPGPG